MHSKNRGDFGERLAEGYLVRNNYEILQRNFRVRSGEIDLVAKSPENILVFVEVKIRSSDSFGYGEESVNQTKARKIKSAIDHFIDVHTKSTDDPDYRFDIVEIEYGQSHDVKINHFEDVEL